MNQVEVHVEDTLKSEAQYLEMPDFELRISSSLPQANSCGSRVNLDPEKVEQGLAKLVLTLIEVIRQLLERQAIRKMESGRLTEDEIERLGTTLMKLEERMEDLKEHFGIDDLNINLGPLGNLIDTKRSCPVERDNV